MKIISKFFYIRSSYILLILCLIFFLLRLPSLFEPNWYGDEGIYQSIGFSIRAGRQYYTGVWDNKPPLLFVIYALVNGDQFLARSFSLLFGLGAVVSYFLLSSKVFLNKSVCIFTTFIFVLLFGLPIIEGNIANSENYMLLPILVSANLAYPVLILFDTKLKKYQIVRLFISGMILSLSFLIKIVSVFDFAAFLTIGIIIYFHNISISHGNYLNKGKTFKFSFVSCYILFLNQIVDVLYLFLFFILMP